jgi:hypothetical protein
LPKGTVTWDTGTLSAGGKKGRARSITIEWGLVFSKQFLTENSWGHSLSSTTADVTMQFSTKVQAANLHRSIRLDGAELSELVVLESNRAYLLKLTFYANVVRISVRGPTRSWVRAK